MTIDLDAIIAHYHAHGYALAPNLLSVAETRMLRDLTDRVAATAKGAAGETSVFDFEDGHVPDEPQIQRIKKPHRVDPFYFELARHPAILAVISRIIGENVRLSHSKINMKAAQVGSPLEWHQDWAFAPHTHMATCVASVMIDDADVENGAMQVLAGSHRGALLEHHDEDGYFVGAIAPGTAGMDLSAAMPLTGKAGTISFHHPMTIHGSGANVSGRPRRILFLEYAAADAFPLFYAVDWADYDARLVAGTGGPQVRVEPNPIKLPFPSRAGSSIYKLQAGAKTKFFQAAAQP
jgi:ectoine hydroxylase-related dioxygenase (phytanoyl-CoA dioxygenase family)